MKTYTYQKPELNLTIKITPPAWAWAQRRFSTPEVYAEHQAAQFLAGRPVDRDVVIELISKPCETEADRRVPPIVPLPINEADPAQAFFDGLVKQLPVVDSAPAETVWPRYYFNQQRGDASPCEVVAFTKYDGDCWYNRDGTSGKQAFCYNESGDYLRRCTPAEASKWLRANGHAGVADETDAAEKYEPMGTLPVVGDRVAFPHTGDDSYLVARTCPLSCDWEGISDDGRFVISEYAVNAGHARILKRKESL